MIKTSTNVQPNVPAVERSPARIPELLAPAGDWDCARAAVENGADAIYFGLERFNARMRARNFTGADLPRLMEFLHERGVKGYVTFNTLVFANEMAEAEQHLRAIIAAGVDAAIVQDVGICRLIRQLSPDFPIHASTQMTITSAAGVEFVRELGCNLVVLARECSLNEIEKIQARSGAVNPLPAALPTNSDAHTATTRRTGLPLEVFVHGALCVAYSGQCLTSEALGGRSANRGECAQACRMPYELICDGKLVPLGDRRYLLSPQDLAGLDVLPDLVRAGVASFKIEGRLKTPEYVANITRVYRRALDGLRFTSDHQRVDGATHPDPKNGGPQTSPTADCRPLLASDVRYEMEMAFSRGLSTGWLRGINNQELVHARFGKKRGVYLGEVTRVTRDKVFVRLEGPLKPGDGVVFDAGHPEEKEQGGRVYEIRTPKLKAPNAKEVELAFGRGDITFSRIRVGDKVWKTDDPDLNRRLRATFEGDQPKFHRPLEFEVHGRQGEPLTLIVRDELGHVAQVESAMPLETARKQPLTTERLREQLGRLGDTSFRLGELKSFLAGEVMLPVRELNRLRREAVRQLKVLRAQPQQWTMNDCRSPIPDCHLRPGSDSHPLRSGSAAETVTPQLVVLVRDAAQLDAALRCGIATLYCEFEDPRKYREAVQRVREWHRGEGAASQLEIFAAPPRIFKMGEEWILKQVRACEADGYLVRNYDHLEFFADCRRIGDFSLNVANALAAEYFMRRGGLERLTASYDLNISQLEALLRSARPEWFEVTLHQHIPMFHMEHCVFCAFLSNGTDYTNCGRPCDKHRVKLRDRVGAEHPLKADAGCRNTLFNALAQTGAEGVARMLAVGARRFRIEFMNELPEQVAQTIDKYRQLLRGEITGSQLWRELKLLNQLGVTRGSII